MTDAQKRYNSIYKKAKEMANYIDALCPEGQEKALAIGALERMVWCAYVSIFLGVDPE